MRGFGAGTFAGALDGMSSSSPCIYPTQKRSYLLESSLPKMLRSSSSRFLIRARAVHDNLHVTGISLQGRIDIPLDVLKPRPEWCPPAHESPSVSHPELQPLGHHR